MDRRIIDALLMITLIGRYVLCVTSVYKRFTLRLLRAKIRHYSQYVHVAFLLN